MADINWALLNPVDTGALTQQGFATGAALVKHVQTQNALRGYLERPDDPTAYNALAAFDPAAAGQIQTQRQRQLKIMQDAQDRQRATSLGELAATDPTGARQEALAAGDFDLAKTFGELADEQRKRAGEFWQQAGSVAFRLRSMKNPEERAAYWQEARPILESQGAPKKMLDGFDPNNIAQVDAAIATAQKVGDLYSQQKPQEFNVGPGEGRYERDPATGEIRTIIAPNSGAQTFGAPVSGGGTGQAATIIGNNNPGALRKPGSMEFQRFATPEAGIEAQHAQLNRYLGRGLNTVGSIIETYAPRHSRGGDNTDAQVDNYIHYVAQRTGIDPRQPINPAQVPQVAAAMREFETGHREKVGGVVDARAIRAAANRAIAAGADPAKVRERAAAQGVTL